MLPFTSSLKTRILVVTGSVIILLMLLISSALVIKWRDLIIQKQAENALSISKTFAVTVVDAMIFEENSIYQKEGILETYVTNFMKKLGTVEYVILFDQNGSPILRKAGKNVGGTVQDLNQNAAGAWAEEVRILRDLQFGWVIEVNQPILLAGKRWGATRIGFDAQPIRDEITTVFFILLTATIVVTGAVLLILFFFVNRITSSLGRFVNVIDNIDLVSDVAISPPTQDDEIGFLHNHFILLQKRLDNSRAELENAQKQVYQAEKLASIGRLASGVAHQVNNPLNGIKSCLYALKQMQSTDRKAGEYLDLINEGIDNIETVVKKLLGFARQQSTSDNLMHVNDEITRVTRLFELRLKEKRIDLVMDLAENLRPIKIDSHLFQEVIMNLLLNSADAIEGEGMIRITAGPEDEEHLFVEMRDTGCGIPSEDLKKIFDPFFTTKDVGLGTGLGLSVCLGIIESHGGRIHVRSAEGEGTTFRIVLPTAASYETASH